MDNSGSRKARIAVNKTQGDVSTKTKVLYQLGLPLPLPLTALLSWATRDSETRLA